MTTSPFGADLREIRVELSDRAYPVVVGPGAAAALPTLVPGRARRAAVVTQANIGIDIDPGCDRRVFTIEDGEPTKRLSTIEHLCREFARWGLTRGDVVIGVGGGVVTDIAGFAAASYHRGVPVVHVATSLLAQVDAAIGGKCGVNLPEGKNLVGAFWQPHAVVCDIDHLSTLPPGEIRCGMGEVAKYEFLRAFGPGGHEGQSLADLPRAQQVATCVAIKAAVVAADEREGNLRAVLNYGHTLAHALETAGRFDLRHGEAVAIGLIYAGEVAHRLGRIDDERLAEHRRVVGALDLPGALPPGADPDQLQALFAHDKKAVDGITLVLDGPDGIESVVGVHPDILADSLAALV